MEERGRLAGSQRGRVTIRNLLPAVGAATARMPATEAVAYGHLWRPLACLHQGRNANRLDQGLHQVPLALPSNVSQLVAELFEQQAGGRALGLELLQGVDLR